jgi:hypothetical protein
MQKRFLAIVVAVAVAVPVLTFGQTKTDFSGTWLLDEAKSDAAGGPGSGGGGGRGGGRIGPPSKLAIKQTAGELTIEQTLASGAQTVVYKLDGSESVNKLAIGESKAKASWDGANLVIAGTQSISTQQGDFELGVKDVYNLANGVLTITATRVTPRGETTRKLLYNKG